MKPPDDADSTGLITHLGNGSVSKADRRKVLQYIMARRFAETGPVQDYMLELFERDAERATADEDEESYRAKLRELEEGPGRPATFIGFLGSDHRAARYRGLVVFDDGSEAVCVLPSQDLADTLTGGESVIVDSRVGAVVAVDGHREWSGESVTLERSLSAGTVLVRLRNEEHHVLIASKRLRDMLKTGAVAPGALLVANLRQRVAYDHVAAADAISHFRFLDRTPIPRMDPAGRAVLSEVVADVEAHVRQEDHMPEQRRKFGLPRSFFAVLLGAAGTGKTDAIREIEARLYALLSRRLGIPIEKLPQRSMTLSAPAVLSRFLGDSEKLIHQFVTEMIELANRPVKGGDGKDHKAFLCVKLEELDGLARRRSSATDLDEGSQAMDRILTTLLQELDVQARPELRDSLIVFLATSNHANAVDPAMMRRLSMKTYYFNRLTRRPLEGVLECQLRSLPVAGGADQAAARRAAVSELSTWLFATQGQDPIADIVFVGGETATKLRRHFLTAAIVAKAAQAAARDACSRSIEGVGGVDGVTVAELKAHLDAQVRNVANLLTPQNASEHLDLPDGARVSSVKRHPKSLLQTFEAVRDDNTGAAGEGQA